jgi:DNA repair protein RadA/Sms
LVVAVASSYKDAAVRPQTAVTGEVGLGGEVRRVSQITHRVNEAKKLGFKRIIIPAGNVSDVASGGGSGGSRATIEIVGAEDVRSAVAHALEKTKSEKKA